MLTNSLRKTAMALMTDHDRIELDKLIKAQIWNVIPDDPDTGEESPQSQAFSSEADILGYGGAAGGGKTDLICGLALTKHQRAIVYRKEAKQLLGVTERITEILGDNNGHNTQQGVWRIPAEGRFIQFGGVKDPRDHQAYQGQPHDLKAFDEVTEMRENQVRFLMGWLRSSNPAVRCRILMTFNPPTTVEGRWIIEYFGPWLNPKHPNPARIGELRWYSTDPETGKDYAVDDGRTFLWKDGLPFYDYEGTDYDEHDLVTPLSRTFIPAKVEDNPYYMATGYKAVLQALPEPLRSQMLLGDFTAGIEDDPFQVCPTAWVEAAMERWEEPKQKGPMTCLGVDPSRGGRDETGLAPRYGMWFDKLTRHPGAAVPDGPVCAGLALAAVRNNAPINVDVIGIGSSVYDHLKAVTSRVRAISMSERDKDATDLSGKFHFQNERAHMYWLVREALDPQYDTGIQLPPDDKLKADLTAITWRLLGGGIIAMESKDEIKERLGRSTDSGDPVAMTFLRTTPAKTSGKPRGPALSVA